MKDTTDGDHLLADGGLLIYSNGFVGKGRRGLLRMTCYDRLAWAYRSNEIKWYDIDIYVKRTTKSHFLP